MPDFDIDITETLDDVLAQGSDAIEFAFNELGELYGVLNRTEAYLLADDPEDESGHALAVFNQREALEEIIGQLFVNFVEVSA